jgi:hypothetical protein
MHQLPARSAQAPDRKHMQPCPCLAAQREQARRKLRALNLFQSEPNHEDYVPRGDAE